MTVKKPNTITTKMLVLALNNMDENTPLILTGEFTYDCSSRKVRDESGKVIGFGYYDFFNKHLELIDRYIVQMTRSPRSKPHRKEAHKHFDKIWKEKKMNRREAYYWLAHKMKIKMNECHIGYFNKKQCDKVIEIVKEYVVRRFNPYHPLTFLLILIMMILAALTGLVKLPYELITEIKDEFRYR